MDQQRHGDLPQDAQRQPSATASPQSSGAAPGPPAAAPAGALPGNPPANPAAGRAPYGQQPGQAPPGQVPAQAPPAPDSAPAPEDQLGPLAGFTVAVTAARRAEELGGLLQRRGATVLRAPVVRFVQLSDDSELLAATKDLADHGPDVVVATTAIGFRGWLEAAEGWGLGESLRARMKGVELLARGPKVKGAVRAAGLTEAWSPRSESMAEVLDRLLAQGVEGRRIAVQLHGEPLGGFVESLRAQGAEVIGVPVYRWLPPADLAPVDELLDLTVSRGLDALTFTSAPAATSLLRRAEERGMLPRLLAALHRDVLAVCVGPVTATPLESHGVHTVQPDRFRLGPLVQALCRELPSRAPTLEAAGHHLQIRGHAVLVDGDLRPVPPAPMAVLRTLAQHPGRVAAHADLLHALPPGTPADEHTLETATTDLRTSLGHPDLVQTVAGQGYRLAVDPDTEGKHAEG